jgi:hypothetical protein
MKWFALVAALAVAAIGISTASVAAEASPAPKTPHITWQPCTDLDFLGMQCGTLEVPVDYSRPESAHVTLAIVRRPATDPAHRIGTLLLKRQRRRVLHRAAPLRPA